jgi:hypothetical protein
LLVRDRHEAAQHASGPSAFRAEQDENTRGSGGHDAHEDG